MRILLAEEDSTKPRGRMALPFRDMAQWATPENRARSMTSLSKSRPGSSSRTRRPPDRVVHDPGMLTYNVLRLQGILGNGVIRHRYSAKRLRMKTIIQKLIKIRFLPGF